MIDMMYLSSTLTLSEYNISFANLQKHLKKYRADHQLRKEGSSGRCYVTNGFASGGFQVIRLRKGNNNVCRIELRFRPQLSFNPNGYYKLTTLCEFKAVEESFNYVMQDILDLPVPSFRDWKVKRIETAVDIRVKPSLIPVYITLFKKGFIPEYFLTDKITQEHFPSKLNSYLMGNNITINWYDRYKTIKNKEKKSNKEYADYSETKGILRIETQWRDYNKSVTEALDIREIKERVLTFYKIIVGTGDYYTLDIAIRKIERSIQRSSKRCELIELLKLIHDKGSINEAKRHYLRGKDKKSAADKFSKRINQLRKLDINPVVLDDNLGILTLKWQFVNGINKKYIFLLTATPVQNHLEELYNLITLLKPGQLRTYRYFKKNFIESKDGIEVRNARILKDLLADVMIRNKRSNVDVTFTKRFATTRSVALSEVEKALYDDLSTFIRNYYKQQHPVLNRFYLKSLQEQVGSSTMAVIPSLEGLVDNQKLSAFDQKAMKRFLERAYTIAHNESETNAKVEALVSILTEFNDKMIIFTKYASTQAFLSNLLKKRGFQVAEFHGGLRRIEKEKQVDFFKKNAEVLVSTEVGGEGRNLQFCNGMINFDLPWNPMAIEQRIGRIHRIGQERDVFVYNLASTDTIEHYILDLLDRKINMFELVVGEVDAILGDIEEKEDFSELVMNAWVDAKTKEEVQFKLDHIGEILLENKQKMSKQKELDDHLF